MKLNAASEKRLKGVKPALVKVVRRAAELTGQDFQIVQGNRTQAEQNRLYAQGRTRPGKVVTWTRNSKHLGGGAVDFAALDAGKISWNAKLYPAIADAFKEAAAELGIGIKWGGDWKTKDWGHVQLTGKSTTKPHVHKVPEPKDTKPFLKRGSKGATVRELQVILNVARIQPLLAIDGDFGPATEKNVKAFQRIFGLVPDGLVGKLSWNALLE